MLSQRQAIDLLLKLPIIGRLGPAFLRYLLVGGLGFVADALLLEIIVRLGVSVYIARGLSMTLAMGCTFLLHRNFTFSDAEKPKKTAPQAIAFFICQCISAGVNYGVFCLLLALLPEPVGFIGRMFALCWGVGAGLAVNFALLRLFVFPQSGAPVYERLFSKPLRLLPWLLAAAWLLQRALQRQSEVGAWPKQADEIGPADPDVWMRLAQVREWIAGTGDFFSHAVPRTNAPLGGIESHWTRPMDALLAMVYNLMPAGGMETKLMLAAAWLPPALGLAALGFLICAGLKRFNHTHVVWCVMLLAAFGPGAAYYAPGDADHHGLLAMLWCGVICLILRPLTYRSAVFCGVLLGLMVWVSIEALLPLAAVYALLGWFTVAAPERMKPLAVLTASAAITAALGLAVEVPSAEYFTRAMYDTLSIVHVALLSFIAAGACVLSHPKIRVLPVMLRLTAAFNTCIFAALFEIALFPKIMFGPMVDADPFIVSNFLTAINEAQGLFARDAGVILNHLWQPVLAALLLLPAWLKAKGQHKREQILVLSALLSVTFIMVIVQGRWTYYLQPVAIIAAASLLQAPAARAKAIFFGWLSRFDRVMRPYAFVFALAVLSSVAGMALSHTFVNVRGLGAVTPEQVEARQAACQSQMRYIVQTGQLQEKLGDEPRIVVAPPGIGGDMLFFTPYGIIAGNYHREGEGLRALYDIENEKDAGIARKRLVARQAGALFVCPAAHSGGWLVRLSAQNHPDWLQPLGGLKYLNAQEPKPLLFTIAGDNP